MARRDRCLLFALAATALAVGVVVSLGVHTDLLLALPVVLFALPLLAGRYLGEERLARLAAAFVSRRRRGSRAVVCTARRFPRALPRGGNLIAASLAVRPPPAPLRVS
jgi:hypothetical protein